MKINSIPTIIALAISALIGYALYALCKTEGQELLLGIGGGIATFIPLATALGVRFEQSRTSGNIAALGGAFTFIMLICCFVYAFVQFTPPAFIIVAGLLVLIFIIIAYGIAKAKQ